MVRDQSACSDSKMFAENLGRQLSSWDRPTGGSTSSQNQQASPGAHSPSQTCEQVKRGEPFLRLNAFHTPEVWDQAGAEVLVSKETHPQDVIEIHALETEAHPPGTGSLVL